MMETYHPQAHSWLRNEPETEGLQEAELDSIFVNEREQQPLAIQQVVNAEL